MVSREAVPLTDSRPVQALCFSHAHDDRCRFGGLVRLMRIDGDLVGDQFAGGAAASTAATFRAPVRRRWVKGPAHGGAQPAAGADRQLRSMQELRGKLR